MDKNQIRRLEEIMANAWPAPQRLLIDGWLLGLAGPLSRRANSVLPLFHGSLPLAEKIAYCGRVFHAAGRTAVFKMTPASAPADLDDRLAESGYSRHDGAIIQTLDLADFPASGLDDPTLSFRLTTSPDRIWLKACSALAGHSPDKARALAGITGGILPSAAFALIMAGALPVACGLAVAEQGWIGLFDLITAPDRRRQGLAQAMVAALLDWGRAKGGRQAYLQVEPANQPALALYAKLGFTEVYSYWYRHLEPVEE